MKKSGLSQSLRKKLAGPNMGQLGPKSGQNEAIFMINKHQFLLILHIRTRFYAVGDGGKKSLPVKWAT